MVLYKLPKGSNTFLHDFHAPVLLYFVIPQEQTDITNDIYVLCSVRHEISQAVASQQSFFKTQFEVSHNLLANKSR